MNNGIPDEDGTVQGDKQVESEAGYDQSPEDDDTTIVGDVDPLAELMDGALEIPEDADFMMAPEASTAPITPMAPAPMNANAHTLMSEALYRFETVVRTDVGRVRKLNEDSVLELPSAGLWLVADGMGGHTAGDFASQTIVAQLETVGVPAGALDLKSRFLERLTHANTLIRRHADELGSGAIGSTVAALLIQQDKFAAIWSGDSRVYRFRGAEMTQVTRDHTEVQVLFDTGQITAEEAENWPRKNVITRAIGVTDQPECDMVQDSLMDADVFLICSDGLTEYFELPELTQLMRETGHGPLEPLCDHLVDTALERGGKDNTSVILLRCRRNKLPEFEAQGPYPELRGLL